MSLIRDYARAFSRSVLSEELTQLQASAQQLQAEKQQLGVATACLQENLERLEWEWEEDGGWNRLSNQGENEFARAELLRIARQARRAYKEGSLIGRAVDVQADYIFGQGMTISAPDADINAVLQAFDDDPDNQAELTEHDKQLQKERELTLSGNYFITLFVNRVTGRVRLASIPDCEVADIIRDPDNRNRPLYYKRVWSEQKLNLQTGAYEVWPETRYYPDWRYNPPAATRPQMIGGWRIEWDVPIYHVKRGGFSDWRFGACSVLAALKWNRIYETFLLHRAKVAENLSHFSTKAKTNSDSEGVAATARAIKTSYAPTGYATPLGTSTNLSDARNAGKTAVLGGSQELEAVTVKGATIHPDEGRRFALQVFAAVGFPETFFGDVSVGTLATAESLDRPTELGMSNLQMFWRGNHANLRQFVLFWAVKAPRGPLRHLGRIVKDDEGGEVVEWNAGVDARVDIDFPPILQTNSTTRIGDINAASPHLPNEKLIARLLLSALGEDDIDEVLAELFPDPQPETDPAARGDETDEEGATATDSDVTPDATTTPTPKDKTT